MNQGDSLDSDHRLLEADMEIRSEKLKVKEKMSLIKTGKLKEQDKIREYQQKMEEYLNVPQVEEDFEELQGVFC